MFTSITYEDLGTTKSSNDILIQKCGNGFGIINLDYLGFCPFCEIFCTSSTLTTLASAHFVIFCGYNDVLHPPIRTRIDLTNEMNAPFLKGHQW
jgi:hypothetical protein